MAIDNGFPTLCVASGPDGHHSVQSNQAQMVRPVLVPVDAAFAGEGADDLESRVSKEAPSMIGRGLFELRAAYRNRTDDLRITRRIQAVHGCPADHVGPACRGALSS